jgi:hypothetical protein
MRYLAGFGLVILCSLITIRKKKGCGTDEDGQATLFLDVSQENALDYLKAQALVHFAEKSSEPNQVVSGTLITM